MFVGRQDAAQMVFEPRLAVVYFYVLYRMTVVEHRDGKQMYFLGREDLGAVAQGLFLKRLMSFDEQGRVVL